MAGINAPKIRVLIFKKISVARRKKMSKRSFYLFLPVFCFVLLAVACAEIPFEKHILVPNGADKWWARSHADVNRDGLLDFFVINNNAKGGWLGWYETVAGYGPSKKHLIAETGPDGGAFACGDLASGDIDNDGDIDVLGPVSPGEWGGGGKPTAMYWYENPSWKSHRIGTFPNFLKDVDLVDLNKDGKLDIAATCFGVHKMIVFRQDSPDSWTQAAAVFVKTLHEGQHVGDLDGDGDVDVVSTAFWFENPGGDMTGEWIVRNIDPYWNTMNGSTWEFNATKIFCVDIDKDKMDEVFISCSEKFNDRVAWYDSPNPRKDGWTMHLVGINPFSHTLQVGDVDADGDYDVLSGNNRDQGDPNNSPVILFLNNGDNLNWTKQILTTTGAYNSCLGDVEGDGDLDFFRYDGHMGSFYELWLNNKIKK
jgi:hypothetical protein